jgi:hypothetical protein
MIFYGTDGIQFRPKYHQTRIVVEEKVRNLPVPHVLEHSTQSPTSSLRRSKANSYLRLDPIVQSTPVMVDNITQKP